MTAHRVPPNGGWPGSGGVNGDDAAARTAESGLTNILDAVEVPIVLLRRDLRIAYFNEAAADVLGFLPADIGRAPRDIAVPSAIAAAIGAKNGCEWPRARCAISHASVAASDAWATGQKDARTRPIASTAPSRQLILGRVTESAERSVRCRGTSGQRCSGYGRVGPRSSRPRGCSCISVPGELPIREGLPLVRGAPKQTRLLELTGLLSLPTPEVQRAADQRHQHVRTVRWPRRTRPPGSAVTRGTGSQRARGRG